MNRSHVERWLANTYQSISAFKGPISPWNSVSQTSKRGKRNDSSDDSHAPMGELGRRAKVRSSALDQPRKTMMQGVGRSQLAQLGQLT